MHAMLLCALIVLLTFGVTGVGAARTLEIVAPDNEQKSDNEDDENGAVEFEFEFEFDAVEHIKAEYEDKSFFEEIGVLFLGVLQSAAEE